MTHAPNSDLKFCKGCDRIAPNPAQGCQSIYCKWEHKFPLSERDRLRAQWSEEARQYQLSEAYKQLENAIRILLAARRRVEELEASPCENQSSSDASHSP